MSKLFVTFSALLLTTALFANDKFTPAYVPPPPEPTSEISPHQFTLGFNYTRAYLKPKNNPSFQGNIGGGQTSYEYLRPCFFTVGSNLL